MAAPWRRNLLEGVVFGASSLVVVELAGGAAGSAVVRVAVGVLRDHGFWKTRVIVLGAVVFSVTAGWRRCSLRGVCYLSPWQRERRWVRRGPHAERPGSVGVPGAVVGGCVEASFGSEGSSVMYEQFEDDSPWWRCSGGSWFVQRVAPRRGIALVTIALVLTAFSVSSPMWL
jgi:hypothetical protein